MIWLKHLHIKKTFDAFKYHCDVTKITLQLHEELLGGVRQYKSCVWRTIQTANFDDPQTAQTRIGYYEPTRLVHGFVLLSHEFRYLLQALKAHHFFSFHSKMCVHIQK